jgi:hypothetical protein
MAEEMWQSIWDYMRANGITVPTDTVTITVDGHEFTATVPDDLVQSSS